MAYNDYDDPIIDNPYSDDDGLEFDFYDATFESDRPVRVRQVVEPDKPRWTVGRIIFVIVTITLLIALILLEIWPLLIDPTPLPRPAPTFIPRA